MKKNTAGIIISLVALIGLAIAVRAFMPEPSKLNDKQPSIEDNTVPGS